MVDVRSWEPELCFEDTTVLGGQLIFLGGSIRSAAHWPPWSPLDFRLLEVRFVRGAVGVHSQARIQN